MEILVYFLLGIAFVSWIMPIFDSIGAVILSALELIKGKITLKITECNAQIQKNTDPYKDIEEKHIAGFVVSEKDDENYEEIL